MKRAISFGLAVVLLSACANGVATSSRTATPSASPTPTCTVGLAATAVNITIEGSGAAQACRGEFPFTQGGSEFATKPIPEAPFGEIVCVVPAANDYAINGVYIRGLRYIVRDTGDLTTGKGVCQALVQAVGPR